MSLLHDHYLERTKRNHFWIGGTETQLEISNLRLGVKNFYIADPDHVDVSNLNRQVIAISETLGMTKVQATINELIRIDKTVKN